MTSAPRTDTSRRDRARAIRQLRRLAEVTGDELVLDVSPLAQHALNNDLDVVLCVAPLSAFSALRVEASGWRSRLKPGGRFAIAVYGDASGDLEAYRTALRDAGYQRIDVRTEIAALAAAAPGSPVTVTYAIGWT